MTTLAFASCGNLLPSTPSIACCVEAYDELHGWLERGNTPRPGHFAHPSLSPLQPKPGVGFPRVRPSMPHALRYVHATCLLWLKAGTLTRCGWWFCWGGSLLASETAGGGSGETAGPGRRGTPAGKEADRPASGTKTRKPVPRGEPGREGGTGRPPWEPSGAWGARGEGQRCKPESAVRNTPARVAPAGGRTNPSAAFSGSSDPRAIISEASTIGLDQSFHDYERISVSQGDVHVPLSLPAQGGVTGRPPPPPPGAHPGCYRSPARAARRMPLGVCQAALAFWLSCWGPRPRSPKVQLTSNAVLCAAGTGEQRQGLAAPQTPGLGVQESLETVLDARW